MFFCPKSHIVGLLVEEDVLLLPPYLTPRHTQWSGQHLTDCWPHLRQPSGACPFVHQVPRGKAAEVVIALGDGAGDG